MRPGGADRTNIGGDNRPDRGGQGGKPGKRPEMGDIQQGLKERPGKQAALDGKKPDLGGSRPKGKPGGSAFDPSDGAKAKDFAKRGQASLGDRGARDFSAPSGGGGKQIRKGGGGGGPKLGGGGGRGGGQVSRGGGRGGGTAAAVVVVADGGLRTEVPMRKNTTRILLYAALLGWNAPALAQEAFATPRAPSTRSSARRKAGDTKAILTVLGPDGRAIVSSGDPVADTNVRENFVAAYDAKHAIEMEGDGTQTLMIGDDEWPFPIPLVNKAGEWQLRHQGRCRRDSSPPRRPQRAFGDPGLPRLRPGAE